VAAGLSETIVTSPDGVTWTARVKGMEIDLNDVTCRTGSDTLCLAVGSRGTILASPNGETWSLRLSGMDNTLRGITHRPGSGDPLFVAIGDSILYSADGAAWHVCEHAPTYGDLQSIIASPSTFVAVGRSGTIVYSTDGRTWVAPAGDRVTTEHLYDITWSGTHYVAVGDTGTVVTSEDGESWTAITRPGMRSLRGVSWIDTIFVAVGLGGIILTSPDGVDWTEALWDIPDESKTELKSVAGSGDVYVAVGGNRKIVVSTDGVNWSTAYGSSSGSLGAVIWTGQRFISVGEALAIFTSP